MTTHDLLATLTSLAGICRDGERRYRVWAQCAQADELRIVLLRRIEERAAAAAELQRQIDGFGGAAAHPVSSQIGAGRAMPLGQRRATPFSMPMPVPASAAPESESGPACTARSGDPADDIALLLECEAVEARAIDAYWHALAAPLPRRVQLLVQNQYAAIKRSHRRALVMRCLELGRPGGDAVAAPAVALPHAVAQAG